MTESLKQLVAEVIAKEEVGTLFLGRGNRLRRVFFSGTGVHLLDAGLECRLVPPYSLVEQGHLERQHLQEFINEVEARPRSLGMLLRERHVLPEDVFATLLQQEELEELWLVLSRNANRFFFEEGSVPEEILVAANRPEIPGSAFLAFFEARENATQNYSFELPSREEILVLSEVGMAISNSSQDPIFSSVARLIDGVRSMAQLLRESPFFPHTTAGTLVHGIQAGWLKKTRFPELQGVVLATLSPSQLQQLLPQFENAVQTAADPLSAQRALANAYAKLGEKPRAAMQLLSLGETHLKRHNRPKALQTFQEALALEPANRKVRGHLERIYLDLGDEALRQGETSPARDHIERAIRMVPQHLENYLTLSETFRSEESLLRGLPRIFKYVDRNNDIQRELFRRFLERFPDGVSLRKRYVNFLLDQGAHDQAAQELQFLAGKLLDRGHTDEAHDLYRKIARLDPERGQTTLLRLEKNARTPRRRSVLLKPVVGALLLFACYESYLYLTVTNLMSQANALTEQPLPALGSDAHQDMLDSGERVMRNYRSLRRRHFIDIWGEATKSSFAALQQRVDFMENHTRRSLDAIAQEAQELELTGKFDDAVTLYKSILAQGSGTEWVTRATDKIASIQNYLNSAQDLKRKGEVATSEGRLAETYELYTRLMIDYSRAPAAHQVRLPISLVTVPPGAEVRSGSEVIGTTPFILWCDPLSATELELRLPGYHAATVRLQDVTQHQVSVPLTPQ